MKKWMAEVRRKLEEEKYRPLYRIEWRLKWMRRQHLLLPHRKNIIIATFILLIIIIIINNIIYIVIIVAVTLLRLEPN